MVAVRGMSYASHLTDDHWDLLEPVFNAPGKRGRKHANCLEPARARLGGSWGHRGCRSRTRRVHELEVRRVGWDDKQPVFRPIRHALRVEVAHGGLGRSRRLAKSFENTTTSATGWLQLACIATTLRQLSRERARRRPVAVAV